MNIASVRMNVILVKLWSDGLVQEFKFVLPGKASSAQQEEGFYVIFQLKQRGERSDLYFEMAARSVGYP